MLEDANPMVSVASNGVIALAVKQCLDKLQIPDLNGKNILLKPNVGREVAAKQGITTNPDVVRAVYDYLKERFKARFFIGDSPIINTNTIKAFERSGYSDLLKDQELQFLNLDDRSPLVLDIPNGKILKKIKLTGYFNEFDYIISLPVLKFHMHCGASLSFKNMKGLIYKSTKKDLHHLQDTDLLNLLQASNNKVKELDIAIADLVHVMKPDLAIIDASIAQEGMGPSSGSPVQMDTIIASTNFLAADIVALAISQPEWTLEDVPHLSLIADVIQGAPRSLKDVNTFPPNIQEFTQQLEPPPKSITIKYNNVHLIDVDSCSACLSTVFTLLKNNKDLIDAHYSPENPIRLAIGKGIRESDLYDDTFLIGNCTNAFRQKGHFIKGCTPVESTIIEKIKEAINLRKKND